MEPVAASKLLTHSARHAHFMAIRILHRSGQFHVLSLFGGFAAIAFCAGGRMDHAISLSEPRFLPMPGNSLWAFARIRLANAEFLP